MASNLKEQPELLSKAEEVDEKALIQRILKGEQEQFHVLVRQYQGRIFSLTQRLLCNPEEAEDCAQEAFLKAYQNLSRFSRIVFLLYLALPDYYQSGLEPSPISGSSRPWKDKVTGS